MNRRRGVMYLQVDVFIHDERMRRDPIIQMLGEVMSALDDLRTEVAQNRDAIDSAVMLLQGLKQMLDEAIQTGDPGALVELSAELESQTNRLAEAVSMNTPSPGGGSGGGEDPENPDPENPENPEEPPVDSFTGQARSQSQSPAQRGQRRPR